MQRALVVGISLVCLNVIGMAGGWVSPGGGAEERSVVANVWSIKSLRVQMTIDNLLKEDYEEVLGFPSARISVHGGVAVNF